MDINNAASVGQQVRERAQRLYMIGEWNQAAQLLLALTVAARPEPVQVALEESHG